MVIDLLYSYILEKWLPKYALHYLTFRSYKQHCSLIYAQQTAWQKLCTYVK